MFQKLLRLPSRMRLIHVSLILGFTLTLTLSAKHADKPAQPPEPRGEAKVELEPKAYNYGYGTKSAIISSAEAYLGWSHYYMSCSEFTRAVYSEATGNYLSKWPTGQMGAGYAPWDLKPGDLLFYARIITI